MRFPLRTRYQVSTNPDRAPSTFQQSLEAAIAKAKEFIAEGDFSPERIQEWRDFISIRALQEHGYNSPVGNAVVGITYGIAADTVIPYTVKKNKRVYSSDGSSTERLNAFAFELGANGQQRMTTALMTLHEDDRAILLRPRRSDVRGHLVGAMSVARVAAALEPHGFCYCPTDTEDGCDGTDLLFEMHTGEGACLQIKTGNYIVRHAEQRYGTIDNRILHGTARFNQKYSLRWIPIVAGIETRFHFATIVNRSIRKAGDKIVRILQRQTCQGP